MGMKKLLITIGVIVIGAVLGLWSLAWAETDCSGKGGQELYECLGKQIDELGKSLEMSKAATTPLEQQVTQLDSRVKAIQAQINSAAAKQKRMEEDINQREEEMKVQYRVLTKKTREFYKRMRKQTTLVVILSGMGSGQLNRELNYLSETNDKDRQIILQLSQEVIRLEGDKESLEKEKVRLASLQADLDKQSDKLKAVIKEAKDWQATLTSKISQLSAKQKEILAQKNETFQTTVGDVPLADDPASRPDYNPGFSPAYAAFSFGAPHFKGMSQYGAYGRAKSGQGVEDILRAYYGGGIEIKKDYSTGINITVQGYGTVDIETYVKRIYEMPNSWGDNGGFEALKAQAVAARSYALAYTSNGSKSICATEACQVYKNANKGGKWDEAVNATKGWVLMANGKPFSAWYASTSGGYQESYTANGYSTPGMWDTPSGRSGWTSQAYEKQAGSPWFYKAWYKSRGGDSCGRSHPWLTSEEMADILNVYVLVVKNGYSDDRIVPQGGCWGGNPYSLSEMRDKANSMGGGYREVSGVSVIYSDGGYTSEVRFDTDRGSVSMSGADFKKAFNLRAPGRIALKSGLFNIEKK